jgi:hypothetical protein
MKYHRLGGLETTYIYLSQFWKLESPRSRCWQIWCLVRTFFLIGSCVLNLTSHEGRSKDPSWASFIRTSLSFMTTLAHDLIICLLSHFLRVSPCRQRFQITIFLDGRNKHSDHTKVQSAFSKCLKIIKHYQEKLKKN